MGNIEQPAPVVHVPTIPPREAMRAPEPKQKRKRQKHRPPPQLVKLIRLERAGGVTWAARWIDPVTGKGKQESLTALGFTDEADCRKWCEGRAQSLRNTMQAIAAGTAVVTQTTVADAVKQFHDAKGAELKTGTMLVYHEATGPFAAWAAANGLAHVEGLNLAKLSAFRDWLVALPAHVQAKKHGMGKGKSARVPSDRKRSPETINKKLRAMRTVAGFWRKRGLCPLLDSDAIADALEFSKVKRKAPEYLRVPEIRKLLESVARHDAELDDGKGHHHAPIGDFLVAALLSGCRFSELANLRWDCVDLDAQEIRLSEHDTKTGHARTVDLDVSPHLAALLAHRQLQAEGNRFVFGPMKRDVAEAARKRLVRDFGAPRFYWHLLRKTTGTFLTCAPSIYGAASAFMAAKRQGHSVAVSEKHYAGAEKGISPAADTLEKAMGVADLLPAPVAASKGRAAQ